MFADKAIIPNLLVNCLFFVLLGRARLEDMMPMIMDGVGGAEGVGGGSGPVPDRTYACQSVLGTVADFDPPLPYG